MILVLAVAIGGDGGGGGGDGSSDYLWNGRMGAHERRNGRKDGWKEGHLKGRKET